MNGYDETRFIFLSYHYRVSFINRSLLSGTAKQPRSVAVNHLGLWQPLVQINRLEISGDLGSNPGGAIFTFVLFGTFIATTPQKI